MTNIIDGRVIGTDFKIMEDHSDVFITDGQPLIGVCLLK